MRKPWPAKRQRIRLGFGEVERVYTPKMIYRKKKEKPEIEPEEKKEEEQPEAEVSEEATEWPEEAEEGVQETFGLKEEERIEGTVKYFNQNKGYGFITGDDGKEYYVNKSELKGDVIEPGDRVSFKSVEGDKGMKAEDVGKKKVV